MEAIKKATLPNIEIYCGDLQSETLAKAVGYGIEEEGLPYKILTEKLTEIEAHELTKRAGLGVVAMVSADRVTVFARQLKKPEPLFDYMVTENETAKTIGKNAARIVKNKPFLEVEDIICFN
ncbi:MAG TPA: glycerol dehydratase reactivase beta/small subunit family protein [Anaerovoracaceae bacterium]|nr:glycerol dehydratase reactivase beta/small subunit family protein [Anaerovoracaceae bacterium]